MTTQTEQRQGLLVPSAGELKVYTERSGVVRQLFVQEGDAIVKANVGGLVSNIQVSTGQEAKPQLPLMTITPADSELLVELLVPARAIGFIEPGQAVKLRYSAFSYQKFGLYDATIKHVSNSVLLPHELKGIALQAQEPVYRVSAQLAQQHVDAYGKALSLKPGITLEADIELAERSLLEWLLEPLFSLKGRL